jgi:hypothetical protein
MQGRTALTMVPDSDQSSVAAAYAQAATALGPDPRPDRVAESRRRLARGFYHAILVRAKVAGEVDRVLRVLDQF